MNDEKIYILQILAQNQSQGWVPIIPILNRYGNSICICNELKDDNLIIVHDGNARITEEGLNFLAQPCSDNI